MPEFVHLHNHSEYSVLDGAQALDKMLARAAELEQRAIAITDHGAMYGAIPFYKRAKKAGVKPIIGYEAYVAKAQSRHEKDPREVADNDESAQDEKRGPYHLTMLAEDISGYQNLMKLSSIGHLEGRSETAGWGKPRVDREVIERHSKGVIALSGCLSGELARKLLAGDEKGAEETVRWFKEVFGERYFIEVQRHGIEEQERLIRPSLELAKKYGVQVVATNDAHYTMDHDHAMHDVLLCMQTGKKMSDPKRWRFDGHDFYLKSADEMAGIFPEIPEALRNTLVVAERCDLTIPLGGDSLLPPFDVPEHHTPDTFLRERVEEGLRWRYGANFKQEHLDRIDEELAVITQTRYATYFLIVSDFIRYAREADIPVGPGRGSAAGSLVCYCLGITNVDPIQHGLLFERFLNKDRVSMPDIDVDFSVEGRERVINYVREKYGADRVAQIATFGTMKSKAALRKVASAMEIPIPEVDKLAKAIPVHQGQSEPLEDAVKHVPELREAYSNPQTPHLAKLIDVARSVEGLVQSVGTHAAGVVIAPDEITNHSPLQRGTTDKSVVMTQYDGNTIGEIGLLKMDFLGLQNLDIIQACLHMVERDHGKTIDLNKLELDDPKTFELICRGETDGVFQLESAGMKRLLTELQPQSFADIAAVVALFRPGPMQSIPDYIARRHGRIEIAYPHDWLEPVLKETYGAFVYQEQVMMAARVLAGYSLSEADILRKAMGKKDKNIMDAQREKFLKGCVDNGISAEQASELFDGIAKFAEYGFNKSHAVAYAVVAYWTAYLKANYPLEYMTALLNAATEKGKLQKAKDRLPALVGECRRRGIEVLAPDVNRSQVHFSVDGPNIRFGLSAIKDVGESASEVIVAGRAEGGPYVGLQDLCERALAHPEVNARAIQALVKSGSCDQLHRQADGRFATRARLQASVEPVLKSVRNAKKKAGMGQFDLFAGISNEVEELPAPEDTPELDPADRLKAERETLRIYMTGHPLEEMGRQLGSKTDMPLADLSSEHADQVVRVGGLVRDVKKVMTRKQEMMAKAVLEDALGATVEVTIFPRAFSELKDIIVPDAVVLVEGRVKIDSGRPVTSDEEEDEVEEQIVLFASQAWTWQEARNLPDRQSSEVHLELPAKPGIVDQLVPALRRHPGSDRVIIHVHTQTHHVAAAAGEEFRVSATPELIEELSGLIGSGGVKLRRQRQQSSQNGHRDRGYSLAG